MSYLVCNLYTNIGSHGNIAVGINRHSNDYPRKSQLNGLIAASLGIDRADETKQQLLANSLTFAIKVIDSGNFLQDFHTVQVPSSKKGFHPQTRSDELSNQENLNTIVSYREYQTDVFYQIALALVSNNGLFSLATLKQALLQPKYHLYLGRKSCPLAAPLEPQIIDANCFFDAFNNYKPECIKYTKGEKDQAIRYYWEGDITAFDSSNNLSEEQKASVQQLTRHDMPISRQRWQFAPRQENLWLADKEKS